PKLGRWASPHDLSVGRAVVFVPGTEASGENPGHHGVADAAGVHAVVAESSADACGNCRRALASWGLTRSRGLTTGMRRQGWFRLAEQNPIRTTPHTLPETVSVQLPSEFEAKSVLRPTGGNERHTRSRLGLARTVGSRPGLFRDQTPC